MRSHSPTSNSLSSERGKHAASNGPSPDGGDPPGGMDGAMEQQQHKGDAGHRSARRRTATRPTGGASQPLDQTKRGGTHNGRRRGGNKHKRRR